MTITKLLHDRRILTIKSLPGRPEFGPSEAMGSCKATIAFSISSTRNKEKQYRHRRAPVMVEDTWEATRSVD